MNILAIDPATRTGWAHSCGACGTWDLSIRKDESSGMRLIRLRGKLEEIRTAAGVEIVFFEAQRGGMPGRLGALVVQAELQGVIKLWCEERKIEYRGVSPTEIKKHATGSGIAKKDMMIARAKAKWPTIQITDDNTADALWILDFAQKQLQFTDTAKQQQAQPALI